MFIGILARALFRGTRAGPGAVTGVYDGRLRFASCLPWSVAAFDHGHDLPIDSLKQLVAHLPHELAQPLPKRGDRGEQPLPPKLGSAQHVIEFFEILGADSEGLGLDRRVVQLVLAEQLGDLGFCSAVVGKPLPGQVLDGAVADN